MTIQDAIKNVNESFSTIYSKDDVLKMLNEVTNMNDDFRERLKKHISEAIKNRVDDYSLIDIADIDSAEYEIVNGNEIEITYIDIDNIFIGDDIANVVVNSLVSFFDSKGE